MARYAGDLVGINFILKLRMVFGFYYNICENVWLKYAIKALLGAISVQYIYVVTVDRITSLEINEISRIVEYVIYVTCSLQTEEEYLINYLSIDTIIDDKSYLKNNRKNVAKFLVCYIVSLIIISSLFYVILEQHSIYPSIENTFTVLYISFLRFGIEIGRIPIVMVFIVMYFRVKIFCTKLRKEVLNNATAVLDWKKYVKIYIKILDTLEKTDWPLKFMMLVHLIIAFINVTSIQFRIIRGYKENDLQFDLKTIIILSQLVYKYTVLFYPSVIMEMITDQLDALKIQIADKMITCTCERRRSNLRELLKYFRENPMKYCICRAFQVYSRLPLGYLSLAATYLVCLLQFTHVLKET